MKVANYILWQKCFDDSKAFMDLYFRKKYTNRNTMSAHKNGQLAAALQMLPYSMTFNGTKISTAYISGACTHPDFRSRGIMRKLLQRTHSKMLTNGNCLSTLIPAEPWLWNFYAKSGYAPVFKLRYETKNIAEIKGDAAYAITSCNKNNEQGVYAYFSRKMSERPCCILHTFDDFKTIAADLHLSEGQILATIHNNNICGIMFAYAQEKVLCVTDILTSSAQAENSLLLAGCQAMQCNTARIKRPVTKNEEGEFAGMARVLNPLKLMNIRAEKNPEEKAFFHFAGDDAIAKNNGFYHILNGSCTYSAEPINGIKYTSVNTAELTAWLMDSCNAYMSLMLD